MSRRRSSKSKTGPGPFSKDHGPISPLLTSADSQLWSEPSGPSYTYTSSSGRQHRRPGQQLQYLDVQDYSPLEYCGQMPNPDFSPPTTAISSGPSPGEFESSSLSRLGVQNDYYSSNSPLTPRSETLTFASTAADSSEPMSRAATNDPLVEGTLMMRLNSATSYDFPCNAVHSPVFNLSPSNDFSFEADGFSSSTPDFSKSGSYPSTFPITALGEEVSSVGNSPTSPDSFAQSRAIRRARDQNVHGRTRPLRPKVEREESSSNDANGARMVKVPSADGKTKDVVQIPRAPCPRITRTKAFCPHCPDQTDGFHGDHELRRHIDRVHSSIRKVWVCKDISPDGKFLSKCKACRNGKTYGANYNAAAHLRRTHFFPCKKGRGGRGKGNEKRGGKGGGTEPSMDVLKHWMIQVDECVNDRNELVDQSLSPDQESDQFAAHDYDTEPLCQVGAEFDPHSGVNIPYLEDNFMQGGVPQLSQTSDYNLMASAIDSPFDAALAFPADQQYQYSTSY
ncbi:MAG: hypothetical protein Q9160_008619 [Pyrenula sp. 1 TL-2023]